MATTTTTAASSSLTDTQVTQMMTAVKETLYRSSGRGFASSTFETILSQHDRFATSPVQLNAEHVGFTFFTRPKLNMTTTSLRQDPQLAMMETSDPLSYMFGLRCLLDTKFMRSTPFASKAEISPWVNTASPFNIPMGNLMTAISGFPDFTLETDTTAPGYYAQDMTLVRGSDMGRKTYNLTATFRDIQGGVLMAFFYYWLRAMALQMEGLIVPYPEDREANRLNYTCSIYRFVMDPSLRTIVKWAKATGCYPVSIPIGDCFNISQGDVYVHTSREFSVPFVANNITYMDPRHLQQFNILMERYAGSTILSGRTKTKQTAANNFTGLPYIDLSGSNELMWMATTDELTDTYGSLLTSLTSGLSSSTDSSWIDKYLTDPDTIASTSTT